MTYRLREGGGRLNVCLRAELVGDDWLLLLTGGERPHLGATALAWSRGGEVETRVLTVPGHREDEVARACAEACCRALGRTVQVSCGIHIDRAEAEEVRRLVELARQATERFLRRAGGAGRANTPPKENGL